MRYFAAKFDMRVTTSIYGLTVILKGQLFAVDNPENLSIPYGMSWGECYKEIYEL